MIKAVLFDYGGVISSGGHGVEITDRIARNLEVSSERALELLDIGWTLYANGKISEADFWAMLEEAYGQKIPAAKRNIWNDWQAMQPKPEMLDFVRTLKKQGLTVGLLSNVIPFTMEQIRDHGVYDEFDFAVLSAEVGVGKPDELMYRLALEKMPNVQPEDIIFVDDQERFLEPAKKLGMHVIHGQSSEQIIADVTALLER
jgi:putative hydrolase of the HAD superfamily